MNHMYFIFLDLRVHDNSFTIPLSSGKCWIGRKKVGRHFLIAVPYSCYLTKSFISLSIHKRGTGRIYSQSRGCGQGKNFLGLRPRPPSSFAPPIKYPGGATEYSSFHSSQSVAEPKFCDTLRHLRHFATPCDLMETRLYRNFSNSTG